MNPARAAELVHAFPRARILVVGDLMLDEFIWGKVDRISPEAPVPVVQVVRQSDYPGGAANVARNLREFTSGVELLGAIGADDAGAKLHRLLHESGIGLEGVLQRNDSPTIVKTRIIARQQQVVRVDRETRVPPPESLASDLLAKFHELLPRIDAVIVEDYGKGFLTQSLLDRIAGAARAAGKILTGDPNIRNPIAWRGFTAVKPNLAEALHAAGIAKESVDGLSPEQAAVRAAGVLRELWDPDLLLITLGEGGLLLDARDSAPFHSPTRAREVFDVSGAGDTAIALFTLALCAGATPREAADISNHASGVVVGKLGTATLTPEELLASFAGERDPGFGLSFPGT